MVDAGLIGSEKSAIDSKANIYFPTNEDGSNNVIALFDDEKDLRLATKPEVYPTKERIRESLRRLLRFHSDPSDSSSYRHADTQIHDLSKKYIFTVNDREVSIDEICNLYVCNAATCFKLRDPGSIHPEELDPAFVPKSTIETFASIQQENGLAPTIFKHPLSLFNLPSPIIENQYVVMSGGIDPLENYERSLTQHACKLDLLDRYGLDVEFDDITNGHGRDENGNVKDRFTVFNISVTRWFTEKVEQKGCIETISLVRKRGRFAIPIKTLDSSLLVTLIAAAVAAMTVKEPSTSQQQLVEVEKPQKIPLVPLTVTTPSQQQLVPLPRLQPLPTSLIKNVPKLSRVR